MTANAVRGVAGTGAQLFARYAYPPNVAGYCGPTDESAALDALDPSALGSDIHHWAQQFDGAWPYLSLMAETTGIGDPLDRRVVEAYWLGNDLLDAVPALDFGNSLRDRIRPRSRLAWPGIQEYVGEGVVPHHSFHVFCVYPWVGLLRGDSREIAVEVLNRCRIRSGSVLEVFRETVIVETNELEMTAGGLRFSAPSASAFRAIALSVEPGQLVSLHWDWICEVIDARRAKTLQYWENRHVGVANSRLEGLKRLQ